MKKLLCILIVIVLLAGCGPVRPPLEQLPAEAVVPTQPSTEPCVPQETPSPTIPLPEIYQKTAKERIEEYMAGKEPLKARSFDRTWQDYEQYAIDLKYRNNRLNRPPVYEDDILVHTQGLWYLVWDASFYRTGNRRAWVDGYVFSILPTWSMRFIERANGGMEEYWVIDPRDLPWEK